MSVCYWEIETSNQHIHTNTYTLNPTEFSYFDDFTQTLKHPPHSLVLCFVISWTQARLEQREYKEVPMSFPTWKEAQPALLHFFLCILVSLENLASVIFVDVFQKLP